MSSSTNYESTAGLARLLIPMNPLMVSIVLILLGKFLTIVSIPSIGGLLFFIGVLLLFPSILRITWMTTQRSEPAENYGRE